VGDSVGFGGRKWWTDERSDHQRGRRRSMTDLLCIVSILDKGTTSRIACGDTGGIPGDTEGISGD
jgi:hypothetical protein